MNSEKRYIAGILIFGIFGASIIGLSLADSNSNVKLEAETAAMIHNIVDDETASNGKFFNFTEHSQPDSEPILYTGPDQFDSSVIPEDDRIIIPWFGVDRSRGQQLFTVDCKHSHNLYDDPIVFPGEPGKSHFHEFFGDQSLNANSTIESIISNANNTCEVGGDRSAYWVPTAYQDGVQVNADNNKFYYKVGDLDGSTIQPMPLGLRMVAGDASTTVPQEKSVTFYYSTPLACPAAKKYNCKITEPHTFETSPSTKKLPTVQNGDNGLRALIRFPQCWNGTHLWLPGTEHMAYAEKGKCPTTHPVPLVQVQFNLGWTDATGGDGFTLDSGDWYTMHGDFINGWRPETFERLVDVCTRAKRYCGLAKDEGTPCAAQPAVISNTRGCIELRAGEKNPRFFGVKY